MIDRLWSSYKVTPEKISDTLSKVIERDSESIGCLINLDGLQKELHSAIEQKEDRNLRLSCINLLRTLAGTEDRLNK